MSGIKIGRAEPQAIAWIVVIFIGIANNDTQCRCRKALPRREHERWAQIDIILPER